MIPSSSTSSSCSLQTGIVTQPSLTMPTQNQHRHTLSRSLIHPIPTSYSYATSQHWCHRKAQSGHPSLRLITEPVSPSPLPPAQSEPLSRRCMTQPVEINQAARSLNIHPPPFIPAFSCKRSGSVKGSCPPSSTQLDFPSVEEPKAEEVERDATSHNTPTAYHPNQMPAALFSTPMQQFDDDVGRQEAIAGCEK